MADRAGRPYAIASFVLGLLGILLLAGGYMSSLSVILGIAGLICSHTARREGYTVGVYGAGRWFDVASLVAGLIVLICSIVFKFSIISIITSILGGL